MLRRLDAQSDLVFAGIDDAMSAAPEMADSERCIAVIVSRDRPAELALTVAAVRCQAGAGVLSIIVVDSSLQSDIGEMFGELDDVTVVRSAVNLGGAGGFAFGMLSAIAAGAAWVWLMDDDGRPRDASVLAALRHQAEARGLDAVAPMVLDPQNPARFAFPYPVNGRYAFTRDELATAAFLPSTAHLFNGLLIRATAIFQTGLPDLRLFIRGDEIDFLCRMRRAGLRFGTTTLAAFTHPSSNDELVPIWGGRLHVVYPAESWKRRNQYRNRGYNFLRHKMWLILAVDFIRYPYFFLLLRRFDLAGLAEWAGCMWAGIRGRVQVEPVIDLTPKAVYLPQS